MDGYNFVAKSRVGKIGGGVGLYVDNCMEFTVIDELTKSTEYIECIFIEVTLQNRGCIIIGSIYRPPNSDVLKFNSELDDILYVIDGRKSNLTLLAGDYNLDLIKSDTHAATSDFFSNLMLHSFVANIYKPTRITASSATVIDNIFVNSLDQDNAFSCSRLKCDTHYRSISLNILLFSKFTKISQRLKVQASETYA